VLATIAYAGQDEEVLGKPDRAIIGPQSVLSEHNPDRVYPETVCKQAAPARRPCR